MKPRFSILTLLGVTAYVAVNVAAFVEPESLWFYTSILGWLLVVVNLTVCSLGGHRHDAPPLARIVLACTLAYIFVEHFGSYANSLPHKWLTDWVLGIANHEFLTPQSSIICLVRDRTSQLACYNISLNFGLIGGWLALWRYQRLERRAKQESP